MELHIHLSPTADVVAFMIPSIAIFAILLWIAIKSSKNYQKKTS